MCQLTMSTWYHTFLQFLLILFCLVISSVHGGREIAQYSIGAMVSSSGLETSHGLGGLKKPVPVPSRLLNSMQDTLGENFWLPLNEIGRGGNFRVTVGVGRPIQFFDLLFDTGSDTSWIQCQPCVGCDDQQHIFDPSMSQTYSNLTCDGNDECSFSVAYNDGTSSAGYYVFDTLSLTSIDYMRFVFGCAQKVDGNFYGTSGILGTGNGKYSLMYQAGQSFRGLFCYCLPASEQNSPGFLVFGLPAYRICRLRGEMVSLTVNLNQDGTTQYFVKLIGITIGQKRLDVSLIMGDTMNIMIDSGTTITRLAPQVYTALKSEFQNIMSGFTVAEKWDMFDTCYNLDGVVNWMTPEMVMHFENSVDVKLNPSAVTLKKSGDPSQVCLAFAGNNDKSELNIIGNQQLREHNVLLDLSRQTLAFSVATTGCTK